MAAFTRPRGGGLKGIAYPVFCDAHIKERQKVWEAGTQRVGETISQMVERTKDCPECIAEKVAQAMDGGDKSVELTNDEWFDAIRGVK